MRWTSRITSGAVMPSPRSSTSIGSCSSFRSRMLRPNVLKALISAPPEMFQMSRPSFFSTLPTIPGRQTTTSRISFLGTRSPLVEPDSADRQRVLLFELRIRAGNEIVVRLLVIRHSRPDRLVEGRVVAFPCAFVPHLQELFCETPIAEAVERELVVLASGDQHHRRADVGCRLARARARLLDVVVELLVVAVGRDHLVPRQGTVAGRLRSRSVGRG